MNAIPSAQRLLVATTALVLAWAPAATLAAPREEARAEATPVQGEPHAAAACEAASGPAGVHASL